VLGRTGRTRGENGTIEEKNLGSRGDKIEKETQLNREIAFKARTKAGVLVFGEGRGGPGKKRSGPKTKRRGGG